MSLQVAGWCYATVADAGAAACSQFVPVSVLTADGSALVTSSCVSANASGQLMMRNVITPVDGQPSTYTNVPHTIAFPPCIENDYIEAYKGIFGVALCAVVVVYAFWKLVKFLDWSRGEQ